jgi:hypothetical protein
MDVLTRWLLRFNPLLVALVAAGTVYFSLQLPKLVIDNDIRNMIPDDHPVLHACDTVDKLFGSSDAILLALVSEDVLTPGTVARVDRLTRFLKAQPQVERVLSVADIKYLSGNEDDLLAGPLLEGPLEDPATVEELKRRLADWKVYDRLLVAPDRSALAVIARVAMAQDAPSKRRLLTALEQAVAADFQAHPGKEQVVLSGVPVITTAIGERIVRDLWVLTPFSLLIVIVALYLSFRTVRGVILPIITAVVSIIWTFGLMAVLGRPVMLISTTIPVFLTSCGVAYSIHLLNRFYEEMRAEGDVKKALEKSLVGVGSAVIIACVTMMAGFEADATSDVVPVKEIGIYRAYGIGVALLVALTTTPFFLSMGKPRLPPQWSGDPARLGLGRVLGALGRLVIGRPVGTILVTVGLGALGVFFSLRMVVDVGVIEMFREDSEIRVAERVLTEKFGGVATLDIIVEGPAVDRFKKADALQALVDLQSFLERIDPDVKKTLSLADYVRRLNFLMGGRKPEADRVPADSDLIAQYLLLYSMAGAESDFSDVVDQGYQKARVLVTSARTNAATSQRVINEAAAFAREHFPADLKVTFAGSLVRQNIVNELVVDGQIQSVAASLLLVVLVAALIFRTLAGGLAFILPLFALLLMQSRFMGLYVLPLSAMDAMLWAVAFGLVVVFLFYYRRAVLLLRSGGTGLGPSLGRGLGAGLKDLWLCVGQGLVCIIPLCFTLALNFGVMGLAGVPLDLGTALVGGAAIGCGIDYAVHFINRLSQERAKGLPMDDALVATMTSVGQAIIFNAGAIIFGFMVLLSSSFIPIMQLGWLTALTMLTSSLGALTILPALYHLHGARQARRQAVGS